MKNRNSNLTAVLLTAVIGLSLMAVGCVTRRDIEGVNARIDSVQQQNLQTQKMVARLDSTITAEADANRKLRADIGATVDELQQMTQRLLANYNDLLAKIDAMSRSRLRSSPNVPDTTTSASADCSKAYDDAFILVRNGKYEPAIAGFQSFLGTCPKDPSAENANYWIGECYYLLQKYPDAVTQFEYLLKNYKGSANTSRALYKLGRSYQELGQKAEARKVFQRLISDYGGTLEAEQAKDRMKELK
jgi:tol-pal system protein YbgF